MECCHTPFQWLCEVGGYWRKLEHAVIHVNPEHAQKVTCLVSMQGMLSFQELCTDLCDVSPWIIMLKYEVMAADEWHDNGPQDLVTIAL